MFVKCFHPEGDLFVHVGGSECVFLVDFFFFLIILTETKLLKVRFLSVFCETISTRFILLRKANTKCDWK